MRAMLVRPTLRLLLATSVLIGLCGPVAAQTQPALRDYAVLGVESVRVGPGTRVQPGAVGATTGSVRLAAGAAVPGTVVADSIRIARATRVGRLLCRIVTGVPIVGCRTLTVPVVDPALLVPLAVTAGDADLGIPPRTGGAPVLPGAFGAVSVGRGSLLQLAGGDYQMRSIRLARGAQLVCLAECRIGVAEGVRLGPRARLGAADGLPPARVQVDVGAVDGVAFRTGSRAAVAATIFAPGGAVLLGADGDYRGAYVGRSVTVRARSRVREASAFPAP
jgi:hypothetical protein